MINMTGIEKDPVDVWLVDPIKVFINNSSMSGVVLFVSALVALAISNSPWGHAYHEFWEMEISIKIGEAFIEKSLHHWINDGLVAVFFFVVGLELKREVLAGELSTPRHAILPLAAAVGGMVVPAVIYLLVNPQGPASDGWGIPMATDIAFALGVVYLLGDRVPVALKVFLTTLAIADDLGAVLVIAFFYTSQIDVTSLSLGLGFLLLLVLSNKMGIRSTLYYAVVGIAGLWLTFLMSGIHPTIAAVLVAFTIPARPKISKPAFRDILEKKINRLKQANTIDAPVVSEERREILYNIQKASKLAGTPLQRLEHGLHPFVSFVVMPIFALSNAGVSFSDPFLENLMSPVAIGVMLGLLVGKVLGISSIVWLLVRFGLAKLPHEMNSRHVLGAGFLAGIGFTMSLFVSGLAFTNPDNLEQAKIAILVSSSIASIAGYLLLKSTARAPSEKPAETTEAAPADPVW